MLQPGRVLIATLRRAFWLLGVERQGGRSERGRVLRLRQREKWPGRGASRDMFRFQSRVEGRMDRIQNAMEMKEVEEAKSPPGLGHLIGQ